MLPVGGRPGGTLIASLRKVGTDGEGRGPRQAHVARRLTVPA